MTAPMSEPTTELALFELLSLECRVAPDGTTRYYNARGELHRLGGPAVLYASGCRAWYQNDLLHRLDGPAVEYSDGSREWYQNGQRHRLDGPAIEWSDGYRAWFINDKKLAKAKWRRAVASMENVWLKHRLNYHCLKHWIAVLTSMVRCAITRTRQIASCVWAGN